MMKLSIMTAIACGLLNTFAATAQPYPNKPVRLLVPFAPGGPNDVLGRVLAQKIGEQLAQQVVIDNRSGAGGIVGSEITARSVPDGYTLLFCGTACLAINPSLHKKLPYDPVKDFAPVSLVGTAPSLLVVHPSLPVKTLKDLIDLAKSKPGQLDYASAGIGTPPHLSVALLKSRAGIDMVHVPYNGALRIMADLVAGHVKVYISGISLVLPFVKDGRLRAIAVTSAKRSPVMPDVPTMAESGLPGFEVSNWYAIVAPASTPHAIVTRLNREIIKALALTDVRNKFIEFGAEAAGSTPDELAVYIRSELRNWANVIKTADIKPE